MTAQAAEPIAPAEILPDTVVLSNTPYYPASCEDLMPFVKAAADEYDAPYVEIMGTIQGESSCKMVYGDNRKAFGFAQFHRGTFIAFAKEMNLEGAMYESPEHQLRVMAWAFAQGVEYRRHWSVWKQLFSRSYIQELATR